MKGTRNNICTLVALNESDVEMEWCRLCCLCSSFLVSGYEDAVERRHTGTNRAWPVVSSRNNETSTDLRRLKQAKLATTIAFSDLAGE